MKKGLFIDSHMHWYADQIMDFVKSFPDIGLCGCWNIMGALDDKTHFDPGKVQAMEAVFDVAREKAPGAVHSFFWPYWDLLTDPAFPKQCAARIAELHARGICGVKVWKDMGLGLKDPQGKLMMLDDKRLNPIWEKMIELKLILIAHVADPANFWLPMDETNPAYESLKRYPEWHFGKPGLPSRKKLFEARDNLHHRYPELVIVNSHFGGYADSCAELSAWMDDMPNFHVTLHPNHLKKTDTGLSALVAKHGDRLMFETDLGARYGRKVDLVYNAEVYEKAHNLVSAMFKACGAKAMEKYVRLNSERLIRGTKKG